MAQSHRMRRHGVSALPPESFAEHDDETSLPEGTRPSSSPSQNDVLSRSRKSSKKPSSFSKSKFALPTLCVQDTVLGYKSRHESKRWWIRMPTYKKKKITRQLDIKRITRNIMHELWTLDHASSSLSIDDVENMVTKNIINNKDFMAGVTALFIASIGAPLQPDWHETAELFLAMHIQQRKERYGAESVIAECSHQLIYRTGYLDLSLGNDFLCVADLFVLSAVREMEHKLTYNYLFSIWSIGSMILLFVSLTYSILSSHQFHPMIRFFMLALTVGLFAATRRKNQRKANAAYLILATMSLYISWNAKRLSMLKFFAALLIIFPQLTLDFRIGISAQINKLRGSGKKNALSQSSFVNSKLMYLQQQIYAFDAIRIVKIMFAWLVFATARLSQQFYFSKVMGSKIESFVLLLPLLFPDLRDLSFGSGLYLLLQSLLSSIVFTYVFIRDCFQCCCCIAGLPGARVTT